MRMQTVARTTTSDSSLTRLDRKTRKIVLDLLTPLAQEMEACYESVRDEPEKLHAWLAMRLVCMMDNAPETVEVVEGKVIAPAYTKLDVARLLSTITRDMMTNNIQRAKINGRTGASPALGGFIQDIRSSSNRLPAAMLQDGKKPEA